MKQWIDQWRGPFPPNRSDLGKFILIIALLVLAIVFLFGTVSAIEPDFTVDFSANITEGPAPLIVQFSNLVTGIPAPDSQYWWIGDVLYNQSTGPLVTFNHPGTYDVNLTATNEVTNDTVTEWKHAYINVSIPVSVTPLSFQGAGVYGANPVEITDVQTGDIFFEGDTRSRNIRLNSTGVYKIHILSGGLTDVLNSPDYGFYLLQLHARKNILGLIAGIILLLFGVGLFFRRRNQP